MEARHVGDPAGVPDLVPEAQALGLLADGVHREVVRRALVVEALAGVVHAQERLRAEEEVAVVAKVAVRVADLLVVAQKSSVKDERGVHGVHARAGPQQRLDAVARARGEGVEAAQAREVLVLERLVHLLVHRVAARGHHHTGRGVDADVVALGVGGVDAAADAALHDELHERGLVADLAALEALDVRVHNDGDLGLAVGVGAVGAVAGGPFKVPGSLGHVVLELHLEAVLGEQVLVPVDGLAGVVGPDAHEAGVDLAAGVAVEVGDDVDGVDEGALLLLLARVHGADGGAADVVAHAVLLDEERLGAALGRCGRGEVARGARTDDEDLALDGLDAVGVGDGGRLAQPRGGRGTLGGRLGRALSGALGGGGLLGDGHRCGHRAHGGGAGPGDERAAVH